MTDIIQKGKSVPVGTRKDRNGSIFEKTESGWKYVGKSTDKKTDEEGGGSKKGGPKSIEDHAKAASEKQLKAFLDSPDTDKELKKVAKKELDRREEERVKNKNPFEIGEDGQPTSRLSVDQRWKAYETYADMVADGDAKSMIAYGSGGVGKTYTIQQLLKKKSMKPFDEEKHSEGDEGYDFVKITGKSNMTELWKTLYQHNGKLIMFDDCDGFLENGEAIDILKGALDTTGDGTIQYKEIKDSDGTLLPKRFKFKGRVMMITNRPATDFVSGDLQAFKSRSLLANLTMTKDETIAKMKAILPDLTVTDVGGNEIPGVTIKEKMKAYEFIKEHQDEIDLSNLNMRTFGSAVKLIKKAEKNKVDYKPLITPLFGLDSYKSSK